MHQRDAEHRARLNQRFASAKRVAKLASNLLRQDFQANQVILFGSLVNQSLFHVNSDIDLAVSGLTPLDYFSAIAQLQDLSIFKIDLVRLESCKPSLKAVIQDEGQEIEHLSDVHQNVKAELEQFADFLEQTAQS